jgi:hypothetical protein
MFAARRIQQGPKIKIHQIIGVHIGSKNDVAPFPAIPAVRAASRYKFFPPKTDTSVSAIPGFCVNSDSINEHGRSTFNVWRLTFEVPVMAWAVRFQRSKAVRDT